VGHELPFLLRPNPIRLVLHHWPYTIVSASFPTLPTSVANLSLPALATSPTSSSLSTS